MFPLTVFMVCFYRHPLWPDSWWRKRKELRVCSSLSFKRKKKKMGGWKTCLISHPYCSSVLYITGKKECCTHLQKASGVWHFHSKSASLGRGSKWTLALTHETMQFSKTYHKYEKIKILKYLQSRYLTQTLLTDFQASPAPAKKEMGCDINNLIVVASLPERLHTPEILSWGPQDIPGCLTATALGV